MSAGQQALELVDRVSSALADLAATNVAGARTCVRRAAAVVPALTVTSGDFDDVAREAGLGVLSGVLDVLLGRGEIPAERLRALTPVDVAELYATFIGPAIDDLEFALLARTVTPRT